MAIPTPKSTSCCRKGRQSLDQADRKAAYQKAATILASDLPYYIISDQGYQLFYNKALGDLPVDARGNFRDLFLKQPM